MLTLDNFFRGATCHKVTTLFTTFRTYINDVVSTLDNVQVVLDDDKRVPFL